MDLLIWCKKEDERLYAAPDWEINRFPKFSADKTIRILFSNKNWLPAFENKNYEQYGTVLLRRYDKEDNHLSCLIEFEDKAVVDKIISDGHIYINDHRVNIEAMSVLDSVPALMMNHLIVQPYDDNDQTFHANGVNLTGLNNDCVQIIFRKLHIWSLWSIAKTCVRFKEIAQTTFRMTHIRRQFRFCDVFTKYPIPLQQIENFLQMFGSSIENLFIGPHEFNYFDEYRLNDVLLLVGRNCPHLKVLETRNLVVDYAIWNECLPFFSQLESLTLKFANSDMNHVQPTMLPKLASFHITTMHYGHMKSFLQNNWPLEELSMRSFMTLKERSQHISQLTDTDWSKFFQMICEHCASVKKLSIRPAVFCGSSNGSFSTNMMRLSELKNLRHLRLDFDRQKVRPLLEKMLQNGIRLEYLHLITADIGEDGFDIISQFKTINTVNLISHCRYTLDDVIGLTERLPSLSKLCLCTYDLGLDPTKDFIDMIMALVSNGKCLSNIVIVLPGWFDQCTDEKFEELLAIVKKRPIPIKLKVSFRSIRYGPHNVAHFSEKKSNPDLLTVETVY